MTSTEEYEELLRLLPKDLTPEELETIKTGERPDNPAQVLTKNAAILREGQWRGVLIIIHQLGVVGHILSPVRRDTKSEARDDAEAIAERLMDYHEQMTGVRNRGVLPDDEEEE